MRSKTWHIEIFLEEEGERTFARAVLHTDDTDTLHGEGRARHNPVDPEVPEIGDELAVARALADLSHCLLRTSVQDLEEVLHKRVELTS